MPWYEIAIAVLLTFAIWLAAGMILAARLHRNRGACLYCGASAGDRHDRNCIGQKLRRSQP
jgi:hypothetical protein